MPLFEYQCTRCAHRFEALVRGEDAPRCVRCGAGELEKLLSVFAVSSPGERPASASPSPCGSCGDPRGPGACALN